MADLEPLQRGIQHTFRDVSLLRLAMTHPSVAHEHGGTATHNQRLEFLGDAVLQLVLSRELYRRFPLAEEGELTKARARLVNRRFLAEQGRRLHLGGCLLLSHGESTSGGRERPSTLADAFEALLGAMFLDAGLPVVTEFIFRLFGPILDGWNGLADTDNPKGELQERLQAESPEPPTYRLERTSGPDHNREFECAVHHRGVELGRGCGKSKKEAESRAALAALTALGPRPMPPASAPSPSQSSLA